MQKEKLSQETINKILEMRSNGVGYKRIARTLLLPFAVVSDTLIENNMIDHIILPEQEIIDQLIIDYRDNLMSLKNMAKKYKISADKIKAILKINSVEITPTAYHRNFENKIDHNYFENIDTEHKAYWLGFLYADGYNNEKFYQVEITLKHEDRYILEELKKDIKTVSDIQYKEVKLNDNIYPADRLTLYSKKISEDLKDKGCYQKKSLTLEFPSLEIVPEELIPHFIRGYFDGDGSISDRKVMFVGTKNFLEKIVSYFRKKADITPAGYWNMTGQAYQWTHASKKDAIKIYHYLYKDATIFLKRKKERFEELMKSK